MEAPSLTKDIFFKFYIGETLYWRLGHIWAYIEFVLALAVTQRPPKAYGFCEAQSFCERYLDSHSFQSRPTLNGFGVVWCDRKSSHSGARQTRVSDLTSATS